LRLVLFADVYGFSDLVKTDIENTSAQLAKLQNEISSMLRRKERICADEGIEISYFVLSDNIFLIFGSQSYEENNPNNENILSAFINTCGEIYNLSIKHELPFRGAVTAGKVIADSPLLLGKPVIEAVRFEEKVSMPLIFIPVSTLDALGASNFCSELVLNRKRELSVDVPFDGGLTSCFPIISSDSSLVKRFAFSSYSALKRIPSKSRPAKAWKQTIEVIEDFERKVKP